MVLSCAVAVLSSTLGLWGARMNTFMIVISGVTGLSKRALALVCAILSLCLSLAPAALHAQSLSGVSGTVIDQTGAVVSDAKVTVTNVATGVKSFATTSSAGTYTITDLNPGTYTVLIEQVGFQSTVLNNIVVDPGGRRSTADAVLKTGAVSERVEIVAQSITLETSQPDLGATVEHKVVEELPVLIGGRNGGVAAGAVGRQIDDYLFLVPGVQGGEFSHRISGGVDFQNEVTFNGIAAVQAETKGFQTYINPPFEMISEFNVLSSVFSAQYGLAQGVAAYQFATGTNAFHGDAFEILRNNYFDAAGANPPGTSSTAKGPVPVDKEHNYGFSLGGPVYIPKLYPNKGKTFFHLSMEWYRNNQTQAGQMNLPTVAQKAGDFSGYGATDATGAFHQFPIYVPPGFVAPAGCIAPAPGQPWPGNTIPTSCFSTLSQSILKSLPDPQLNSLSNNTQSLVGVLLNRQFSRGFSIDHNLTDRQKLHGSFWRDHEPTPACCNNNAFLPANNPLTGLNPQDRLGTGVFLTYSNVFSPSLVMTAGFGWMGEINNQFNQNRNAPFSGVAGSTTFPSLLFGNNQLGAGFVSPADQALQPSGLGQNLVVSINRKLGISFDNNWLLTRGRHTVNFGFEIHRAYQDDHECQLCGGNFNFSTITTSNGDLNVGDPVNVTNSGSAFASFLLGEVNSATRNFAPESKLRNFYLAPYVQDNIKVTPKLTVDLGLRWDILWPFTEEHNNVVFFDPNRPNPGAINPVSGQPLLGAATQLGTCPLCAGFSRADVQLKHFSPRIGFVYKLNDKTVVLSGFSLLTLEDGAYEFGTTKIANNYGQLLVGAFSANSTGTAVPAYGQWDSAPLPNPPPTPLSPQVANATGNLHVFDRTTAVAPYSQQWNAGVQRELPWNMFLSVAYVGNRAIHLPSLLNFPNQLNPQFLALGNTLGAAWTDPAAQAALQANGFGSVTYTASTCPAGSPGAGTTGTFFTPYANFMCDYGNSINLQQALRPFPQYTNLQNNFDMTGTALYNALQVQAQKRFSNGLSFLAAYTLSRTMSNTDTGFPTFNNNSLNKFNQKQEWTIASNDQTHILNLTGVYELPLGPGKKLLNKGGTVAKNLIGGWQLSGNFSYASGLPFGINAGGDPLLNGFNRADLTGQPINLNWNNYYKGLPVFNPAAFSDPGQFTPGTSLRNIAALRNPFQSNENIALAKKFFFGERVSAELRMEFFNILNRMQICGGPNAGVNATSNNVSNTGFGLDSPGSPCQGNAPRQGQAYFRVSF
jgi:hypothetical protein